MNADPFRPIPTREQYADDLAFLRGIREAEEHMEPDNYAPNGAAVFIVIAAAFGTCMGVAVAIVEWVL